MTNKQSKTIIEASFLDLVYIIEKHVNEGWKVSQEAYPLNFGMNSHYEVTFEREESYKEAAIEITEDQVARLQEVGQTGIVVPIVNGVADSQVVESAVQAVAKRGPKPKAK